MKKLTLEQYQILFSHDFCNFKEAILGLSLKKTKMMVVFDSNTAHYYQDEFMNFIKGFCYKPFSFRFEAGEQSKNLETVKNLYEVLINEHFERQDVLIAFGGGVVGDLSGFAAATYLRGIRFIQIPTSLLAMADSSIGGKTGVDFLSYKNMIGAFHCPSLVYINLNLLSTLPDREYFSGMAEIIKAAYIKDKSLLEKMVQYLPELVDRNPLILEDILYHACSIKKQVVEADFKEAGERALLNFGHTIGHAIEKLLGFKLLHGECVSLGMVVAVKLSTMKGYLSPISLTEFKSLLSAFHLPVKLNASFSKELSSEKILLATRLDKKMQEGAIRFVLLKSLGEAYIDHTVTDNEILLGVKEILEQYEK